MVYLKEVLVYLAVLIAVTVSQPRYGQRRADAYTPPKPPTYKKPPTYNPVKDVVKIPVHPKKINKLPIGDPLGTLLPENLPVNGGFFPRDNRDSFVERIDSIGDRRRNVGGGSIPWTPRDVNPRIPRVNDPRIGQGLIPNDPLGPRSSDRWMDRNGGDRIRGRGTFPSSVDRSGGFRDNTWNDRRPQGDPMGPIDWTDTPGSQSRFPRVNGRLPGRRSSLSRFTDESSRSQRRGGMDPREQSIDGFLGGVNGFVGQDVLPDGNTRAGLRDLNPSQTDRLRSRLLDTVNLSGRRQDRSREFQNGGRRTRGFNGQLPTFRERQNW